MVPSSTRPEDVTQPTGPPRSGGSHPTTVPVGAKVAIGRRLPGGGTASPHRDESEPAAEPAEVPNRRLLAGIRFAVVGSDNFFMISDFVLPEVTYEALKSNIGRTMANKIKTFDMYRAKEWGQAEANVPWLKRNSADIVELQRFQIREEVKAKYLAPSKRIDSKTFKAAAFNNLDEDTAIHVLVAIDEPTGCCPCAPGTCKVLLSMLVLGFLVMAIVGYIFLSSKNEKGRPDYLWSEPLAQIGVVCIGALAFLVNVCYCVNFRAQRSASLQKLIERLLIVFD